MKYLIASFILLFSLQAPAQEDFAAKPYLQIGNTWSSHSLHLLWHATDSSALWLAEYKTGSGLWMKAENQTISAIAAAGIPPCTIYDASFTSLTPGSLFMYRVSKNGKVVFNAEAKASKSAEQPFRFVVSGDM